MTTTIEAGSTVAPENIVATLLNISISNRDVLMSTRGLLDALSHVLRLSTSTPATVQTAAATLYSLLVVDEYRLIIGAKRDIIFALVDIIRNSNSPARSMKDALKANFGISLYPLNRATMDELGAVPALFSLVVKDGWIGVIEDATAIQLRGLDAMTNFATPPKAKQKIQVQTSSEYDSFYCYLCYCDIGKQRKSRKKRGGEKGEGEERNREREDFQSPLPLLFVYHEVGEHEQ